MKLKLSKIMKELKEEENEEITMQRNNAMKKATELINKAFKLRPDLCPKTEVLISESHTDSKDLPSERGPRLAHNAKRDIQTVLKPLRKIKEYQKIHVSHLNENTVLKKLKNDFGVKHAFFSDDSLKAPLSTFQNETIYVNDQHPIYKFFSKKGLEHETTLLVQILIDETVILKKPADIRQFQQWRNDLITVAYLF